MEEEGKLLWGVCITAHPPADPKGKMLSGSQKKILYCRRLCLFSSRLCLLLFQHTQESLICHQHHPLSQALPLLAGKGPCLSWWVSVVARNGH